MSRVDEGLRRVQEFFRQDTRERVRAANLWTCQACGTRNTNRADPCQGCPTEED